MSQGMGVLPRKAPGIFDTEWELVTERRLSAIAFFISLLVAPFMFTLALSSVDGITGSEFAFFECIISGPMKAALFASLSW